MTGLVGVCCSSLCFLGLPLLAMGLSVLGLGWLLNDTVMRAMLFMFLAMYGAGHIGAFLIHRRRGPGMVASLGGLLLLGVAWHKFPSWGGWLALGSLFGAWWWNWRLVKRGETHDSMACHT